MTPNFFLNSHPKSGTSRIILAINYDYVKIKFPTNEKIEPKFWNIKKNRVRSTHTQAAEFNARLDNLAKKYSIAFNRMIKADLPFNRENILKFLEKPTPVKRTPKKKILSFFNFIDKFIEDSVSGKRLIKGHRLSPYTIKGYISTKNHLLAFEKQYNYKLSFVKLDKKFYDDFISYFYSKVIIKSKATDEKEEETRQGHTFNSVGKHIKNLKVFAGEARELGMPVCIDLFKKKFKVLAEDTDQITLSVDELNKIEAVDLKGNLSLDHVRDCFMLASYTGLRFSDLKLLTEKNIIDGKSLKINTQKTGQKVVIPLHRVVLKILSKHNGVPPIPISNQKMNEYIKIVAEKAGLDEPIVYAKTRAGQREEETVSKYQLVTAHTARRSFATNLYLAGMDILTIKKMTGHHTERSFLKYIRVSEEENAARAAQHAFFQ